MSPAARAVDALREAGSTVATAESLTGGLLCATLVGVPGASEVVRGGIIAYDQHTKINLLGVDGAVIADRGTVDAQVAAQMAVGARDRLEATYGLSTTGVAGPGPSETKAAGTVHCAIAGPRGVRTTTLDLDGDRDMIRAQTVDALLSLLVATLGEEFRTLRS